MATCSTHQTSCGRDEVELKIGDEYCILNIYILQDSLLTHSSRKLRLGAVQSLVLPTPRRRAVQRWHGSSSPNTHWAVCLMELLPHYPHNHLDTREGASPTGITQKAIPWSRARCEAQRWVWYVHSPTLLIQRKAVGEGGRVGRDWSDLAGFQGRLLCCKIIGNIFLECKTVMLSDPVI